jgi:hypothetical protein
MCTDFDIAADRSANKALMFYVSKQDYTQVNDRYSSRQVSK